MLTLRPFLILADIEDILRSIDRDPTDTEFRVYTHVFETISTILGAFGFSVKELPETEEERAARVEECIRVTMAEQTEPMLHREFIVSAVIKFHAATKLCEIKEKNNR